MHTVNLTHLITIALLWLGYFVIHSLLASITIKQWVATHHPYWMPGYRMGFNVLSVVLLLPILLLSYQWHSEPLWQWPSILGWVMNAIALLTVVAFYYSLRYYDMAEFSGTRQWRERNRLVTDQENFVIGDFHRFVRHPWYTMGIILIWCRELDAVMLVSAIMLTLYFVIGSRIEEKKLRHYYGETYQRFQQRVPGLIPRPWRYLTRQQAQALVEG